MRFTGHVLILALFGVLTISSSFATDAAYDDTYAGFGGPVSVEAGRSLRGTETNDADAVDAEERGAQNASR
ncbi:hypothetical protein ON010_g8590 [Phytophthora cinnamomi]|nr:hypothetical protein ON010_g8590 [Phytophthora cinnamomi]